MPGEEDVIRDLVVALSLDDSNLTRGLAGASNAVKQAEAKFRAAGAGIEGFEKTMAGAQAKVTMLTEKLAAQNTAVSKHQQALDKSRDRLEKAAAKQKDLAAIIDSTRAAYNAQATATGKDSDEAKALAAELDKLQGQLTANAKTAQSAALAVQKQETALLNAQAAVKQTQADLSEANKALDAHGNAWAQAMKKVSQAGGTLESAGKKLTAIGDKYAKKITVPILAAGTASYLAYTQIDDAVDNITKKTGASGAVMAGYEKAFNTVFKDLPFSAELAGTAVGDMAARFKVSGQELTTLSEQYLKFADINGADLPASIHKSQRVLAQWNLGAKDAAGFLGLLTKEHQRTGVEVDALMESLQQNGATLKAMGLNLSQSTQLLSSFEAAGVNTEAAMAALKKAAAAYAKEGQSLDAGFSSTVAAIKLAKTETEALAIAQKVFGAKGALEMATAIREGRLTVTGMTADMSKLGGVIDQTFDAISGAPERLSKLKNQAVSLGAQFGKTMIPWLEKAMDKVSGLLTAFEEMPEAQQKTIVGLAGTAAAVGPVLSALGKLATGAGVVMKLMSGPAGWIALGVTGLAALGIAINNINSKPIKVQVNAENVDKIKSGMADGQAAAEKTAEIIAGVAADAQKLAATIDSALSDRDISKKEFKAISKFVTDLVNPDIVAAKKALDEKVAAYKISLDSAVDANGNKYTEDDKDVMVADFQAKNSQLLVDLQAAKDNYISLLNSIQKQTSPVTDAQIAQLNEQMAKITAIRTELQIASDEVAAAGRANYNLTISGRGNDQSTSAAIGYVQANQQNAVADAEKQLQNSLAAAGNNADQAAAAYDTYNASVKAAGDAAQIAYQAILDGVSKTAEASTTLKTLSQDYDAFAATLQTLSDKGIYFDENGGWIKKFKDLFGPDGELGKYLSGDQKLNLDKLLIPENANSYYSYKGVRDIVQELQYQIAGALNTNMNDPKLNPIFEAYQAMVDSGAFANLDLTKLNGALEGIIKTNDIERLLKDHGENAVSGLTSGINGGAGDAATAVHNVFQAAIDEANRMKALLNNAMRWQSRGYSGSGNGNGGGYWGGSNTAPAPTQSASGLRNYSASASTYIDKFYNNTPIDVRMLIAQQVAQIRRLQRGVGS